MDGRDKPEQRPQATRGIGIYVFVAPMFYNYSTYIILIILIGPDEQLYFSFIGQSALFLKFRRFPRITEAPQITAQNAQIVSNLKQKPKKKKSVQQKMDRF